MGMFKNMMDKVFGRDNDTDLKPSDFAQPGVRPVSQVEQRAGVNAGSPVPGTSTSQAQNVDVGAALDRMASSKSEKLDWKNSIVDLMKVLDMDSSIAARKDLAQDLNYSGDTNDSAAMNIWLHKEVMRRFADNGGKLPADLDAR